MKTKIPSTLASPAEERPTSPLCRQGGSLRGSGTTFTSASPQDSRTPASQVIVNAGLLGCPGQEMALSIASDRLAHRELLLDKESTESKAPSLLNLEPKPRKRLKRFLTEAEVQPPLENLCSAELEPLLPRRARGSGRGRRPWGQGAWEVGNALGRLPLTQQNARSSRRRVPATNLPPRSLCEGLEINPESQVPAVPGRQVSRSAWHRRGPTWGRASGAPRAPGRTASGRESIRSDRFGGSRPGAC